MAEGQELQRVLQHVVEQHAEEAAFLWLLRDAAVSAPNYSLDELAQLDGRLQAHLEGLAIAGDAGWSACRTQLAEREPGEVFCAAVAALETPRFDKIQSVYEVVERAPATRRGLVSALAWVDSGACLQQLSDPVFAEGPFWRRIGLAVAACHHIDPGPTLAAALEAENPELRATALRVAGALGRTDLQPAADASMNSDDPAVRFRSAWASTLLGNRSRAPRALMDLVGTGPASLDEPALGIALRALPEAEALDRADGLAKAPETLRQAVIGCGVIGEPACTPWLIEQMAVPELARVAGEAFTAITGIDLEYENLEGEWPEGFEAGPTENPEDDAVALDADDDLPWPHAELIAAWWTRHAHDFKPGTRYLLGRPISPEHLQWVLRHGQQRHRQAAALELKLLRPGEPLFEVRARGSRQRRLLQS